VLLHTGANDGHRWTSTSAVVSNVGDDPRPRSDDRLPNPTGHSLTPLVSTLVRNIRHTPAEVSHGDTVLNHFTLLNRIDYAF